MSCTLQYLLKGIYTHNDLLFFHVQLKNTSTVSFDVDYVTFMVENADLIRAEVINNLEVKIK